MTSVTLPREGIPITGNQLPSREWYRWAFDITQRVGGVSAPDLPTSTAIAQQALSRVMTLVPAEGKDVRPGDFTTVLTDAAGYVVDINLPSIVNAVRAYTRPDPYKPVPDDAQLIVAARVFGRKN